MRDLILPLLIFFLVCVLGLSALWFLLEPLGPPAGYERVKPVKHVGIGG
jgi:hypothetical protein